MALELNVNNIEEFQDMVDTKDFRISESIIKTILSNVNTKKKHIHIISINVLESNTTLDITLEKKFFIETLEENLKYFIEHEKYEDCQNIVNAINQLKIINEPISKKKTK
jgi:hypothetical protein